MNNELKEQLRKEFNRYHSRMADADELSFKEIVDMSSEWFISKLDSILSSKIADIEATRKPETVIFKATLNSKEVTIDTKNTSYNQALDDIINILKKS